MWGRGYQVFVLHDDVLIRPALQTAMFKESSERALGEELVEGKRVDGTHGNVRRVSQVNQPLTSPQAGIAGITLGYRRRFVPAQLHRNPAKGGLGFKAIEAKVRLGKNE